MVTALIALASVVSLFVALLAATGNGPHNALAWFIAGVLLYVISTLVASWTTVRARVPRA